MDDALPGALASKGFLVSAALTEGISRGSLRGPSYAKPFRGIRAIEQPKTHFERAAAFAPLLRPWQCFGGLSALPILGLPTPWRLSRERELEVVSLKGRSKPERPGVRVRRLAEPHLDVWEVEGLRVASAPLAWALMGARCTVHELIVLGDAVVTSADNHPDRRLPGPLASIAELEAIAQRWSGRAGAASLRAALPRIRCGVESPRESDMRLFIVEAGMPEPEVQVKVYDPESGRYLGRADLLHRDARVVEEYEGKGHRAEGQWDRDIQKYRDFERIGLHVVRATNRDFVPSPDPWLRDLAAVLRRRTR